MQLEKVTQNNAAAMTEMKEMIQEIRDAVTTSLQAFTDGTTSVAELQESLRDAGVAVSLKPEELERLRTSPEAAYASFPVTRRIVRCARESVSCFMHGSHERTNFDVTTGRMGLDA
jgi:hypothetical protein